MTIDIESGSWTLSFNDKDNEDPSIYDFISGTYNIHVVGRGKWIKKIFNSKLPIEMDGYIELYPVDITHCTIEEYKEKRDDFYKLPFQYPQDIKPLSPTIQAIIDRTDL